METSLFTSLPCAPGATDEECIPLLEKISKKVVYKDFVGYIPEKLTGDKNKKIHNIQKLTSGSNTEARIFVDDLYSSILEVPTHSCSSIKIAEAAKVIENTQRDVNIALMNELAVILDTLDIDTLEVIEAAKTKWNFMPFIQAWLVDIVLVLILTILFIKLKGWAQKVP